MTLTQLQEAFQAHVLGTSTGIEAAINGDARSAGVRLGIYSSAYAARLAEVLGETFPGVKAAMGQKRFERSVGDFALRHPSRFRSARDYGGDLPGWLGTTPGGSRAQGVADLARFEWALAGAFDAVDEAALSAVGLSGVDPEQWPALEFTFSVALRRLDLTSNAVAWWKFACAGQPRPGRWRPTCTQHWLVWRRDLAVCYRRLSQLERWALDAARAGACFGELCERLTAAQAARLLHDWISAGLIVGASVGSRTGRPAVPAAR